VLIMAIQRYFHRLHRVKAAVEAGRSFDDATRTLRPPLFYKQKDEFAAHCRVWTADRLVNARGRIARAAQAARLNSSLEATIAERLLIELSALAKAGAGAAPASGRRA
jgi:DNA polymerase III subunit delta